MEGLPQVVKCKDQEFETPDWETLEEWLLEDGACEALDGCWTEPDGVCPHGYPSWLRVLVLV
jgi:hypothetical protein